MEVELIPPAWLEESGLLQEQMQATCQPLGLEGLLAEAGLAIGVAAWSAVGGGGLGLALERHSEGLSLRLGLDSPDSRTPLGLAPPLSCSPGPRSGTALAGAVSAS
ncbi:conserved hypothetical protein [Desulfarculales bacterium]